MVELYINDELVELIGDESIAVDYAIFDVKEIDSHKGARSYEFRLARTNRNKAIFETPEMVNNLSSIPYTRLKARCYVDGVDTLIRLAELRSVKDYYNIRLYGTNTELYALLRELDLIDLDLSDHDHVWNFDNVVSSRLNSEGCIYPLIDYNQDSPNVIIDNTSRVIDPEYMLPAVFVKTVLEKIFTHQGLVLVNPISDTYPKLNDLILPSYKQPESNFFGDKFLGVFAPTTQQVVGGVPGLPVSIVFGVGIDYDYTYWTFPRIFFNLKETASMKGFVDLEIRNPNQGTDLTLFDGDTLQPLITVPAGQVATYRKEYDVPTQEFPFIAMSFYDNTNVFSGGQLIITTGTKLYITEVIIEKPAKLLYGDYISTSGLLPNMKQITFVKNYLGMFNLLAVNNFITGEVSFIPFDDIKKNINRAYDWSSKVDYSENHEVSFVVGSYSQNNRFLYEDESDENEPVGTDGNLIVNNENIELEQNILELDFSATITVVRLINCTINQIGVIKGAVKGTALDSYFVSEKNPRILFLDRKNQSELNPVGNLVYDDTDVNISISDNLPFTYFIQDGKEINLGFENNLIPTFYGTISDIIKNSKIVKLLIRLNISDINQLDFTVPVYIDKFESYFYISRINGFSFTQSTSTIVEIVKLNIF